MRSIQTRIGVTLGADWYCGVDCFVAAARARYAALSAGKVVDIRHVPRRPVGLLLLSKEFLTEEQLRSAILESELRGETLEQTLMRLGLINERQLAQTRAAQWGCPVFSRDGAVAEVQADVPISVLQACSAVPLHYSAESRRLLIGFTDRVEHSLLASLEGILGIRPEACFTTRKDFAEQMSRLVTPPNYQEMVGDLPASAAEMAKTAGQFAVEIGARDARFARCKDFVWTRLTGKRRNVDLLFRTMSAPAAREMSLLPVLEQNVSSLG